MILQELFNSHESIEYKLNTDKEVLVRFSVGENDYEFEASKSRVEEDHKNYGMWWIAFYLERSNGSSNYKLSDEIDERTGIKVMSTIVKILNNLIVQKNPDALKFSTDLNEPSRIKLYQRMINKLASHKWNIEKHQDSEHLHFILRRS
jgi:hypothetical protein